MENNIHEVKHSTPAVIVQVPDIGYGIPGLVFLCNKSNHEGCMKELQEVLSTGGRVVPNTYWYDRYTATKKKGK